MPSTPTYLIPYPAPTDTPDVPRDMSALALSVENTLKQKQAGFYDSGWQANDAHVTDGHIDFTSGSVHVIGDWFTTAVTYRRYGNIVDLGLTATYKGVNIPGKADGNIGNLTIGVFNPLGVAMSAAWRPHHITALSVSYVGSVASFCLGTTGNLQISAVVPNIGISGAGSGTRFDLQGIWMTDG